MAPEEAVHVSTALDEVTEPALKDPGVGGAADRAGAVRRPTASRSPTPREVASPSDTDRRADAPCGNTGWWRAGNGGRPDARRGTGIAVPEDERSQRGLRESR